MSEDQSGREFLEVEERFLDIGITLVRYSGVRISYSPTSGLTRDMYFRARVEHGEPDDRFEGKPILIRLVTPSDEERDKEIKTEQGIDGACGLFFVRANVQPNKSDEEVGDPPIQARITVTHETFSTISTHIASTLDRIRRAQATLRLVGRSLPETRTGSSIFPISLSDLDVSIDKRYAIGGFEIGGTRALYPRNRVLPVERKLDEGVGASLSILLSDAAYDLDVPTGRVHSVKCHGSVIRAKGKAYDGVSATINLGEFHMWFRPLLPEWDLAVELPEKFLFGRFKYSPKESNAECCSSACFDIDLKHVPGDTRDLIVPILSQVVRSRIILTVDLMIDEKELLAATNELEGTIRDYGFQVHAAQGRQTNANS